MKLEKNLEKAYAWFFREMEIDPDSGRLDRFCKKFATYPYVGSKYGNAKKILFIGLDIGKDPQPGRIQSFSERRISIEDKPVSRHNPHIAGTYMTTLYFLKDELGWHSHWEKIINTNATCRDVLKNWSYLLPSENPLSYCALTNYHKFVKECRKRRTGRADRAYLNRKVEREMFDVELEAFDPDIVFFQGVDFEREMASPKKAGTRFYVAPHPSANWQTGGYKPDPYVGKIKSLD